VKTIRIIVPFPAGGAVDPLVRGLSSGLTARLGQPVLVENRPGATGTIGMAACAKSPPDGYTLCFVTSDGLTVVPNLRSDLPFDPVRDFAPVTLLGYPQSVLVASARAPFDSFAGMIAYAKQHPGKIDFGTFGEGGISHQLHEAIQQGTGVRITNVPYKGTGPAVQAALANEVDLALSTLPVVAPHFPTGKLKPLCVIGRERLPALPNVPTYGEQGLPIDIATWFAIMAPMSVWCRRISIWANCGDTPRRSVSRKYSSQYSRKRGSYSGLTSSKSLPGRMRSPARSSRRSTTAGRPIRIGFASPSSITTWVALSTRSSSPSE